MPRQANRKIAELQGSDSEFRGETIYFLILDRFHAGGQKRGIEPDELDDPSRQDWSKYWGGDLQGLIDKLDYLEKMGISAVWVTPLFQQIETLNGDRAAIHGYWTKDFRRLNLRWANHPEEEALFDRKQTIFDRLIAELHRRDMKFILDIVCNHSSPRTAAGKGLLYDNGKLIADFDHDAGNWYHHYGEVTDWNDEWQVYHCEFEGVAKFNHNNLDFRRYITSAIREWLERGVDAVRIDTVKHMPIWFWQEVTAQWQTHKNKTFCIGEWNQSHPDNEKSVQYANYSGMALLDFALCEAIRDAVTGRHRAGFRRIQEVLAKDGVYHCPTELVTFFENHDMPRLQSLGASDEELRLAVILILTARGIPCLYYGSEQYLHNDTDDGNDPYNRPMMECWDDTELTRVIGILSRERRANLAVQWGEHHELSVARDHYVFERRYRGYRCLVILNRARSTAYEDLPVSLADGNYSCLLSKQIVRIQDGRINVKLGKDEAIVLAVHGEPVTAQVVVHLRVTGISVKPGQTVAVTGDCEELGEWDPARAVSLEYVTSTSWFGEIPFEKSAGKSIAYKFVVLSGEGVLPEREMRTVRRRPVLQEGLAKWRDKWGA